MAKRKIDGRFIGPDMTPMVDVVFQLLTFFIIVNHFENIKADERAKLPRDTLAKPPEIKSKEELVLNVGFIRDQSGQRMREEPVVFYAGEEIPLEKIRDRLEAEKRRFQLQGGDTIMNDVTIILRADTEVPTGLVQRLIKICQETGFTKFSLKATQDEA